MPSQHQHEHHQHHHPQQPRPREASQSQSLVHPTRCPHCRVAFPAALRPVGAQLLRAARAVARITFEREQVLRMPGALLSEPRNHREQQPWITAADLCRALQDVRNESTAGMQLHRAYEAGLLKRQAVARTTGGGGIRYGYRPTLLLAAYELPEPEPESTEEGGNVQ